MPRPRLTSDQLIAKVAKTAGSPMAAAVVRLLRFGDSLQAQQVGRQASISIRLPGNEKQRDWLSLFFVRTNGKVTAYYQYLWKRHGVPASVASSYERRLEKLFGDDILGDGIPATVITKNWKAFASIVHDAADRINAEVGRLAPQPQKSRSAKALTALEGIVSEARSYRRSRSSGLRNQALALSKGMCEACGTPFGDLLGGRGSRVLQVHHKQQLSLQARPRLTKVSDLVVVCANCHMLIHADPHAALRVEALQALWKHYPFRKQ
jgi:hypothetical protein